MSMQISKEKSFMICIFIILLVLFGNAFAEPIHEYVKDGNVKEVKRLIKEGADVNAEDKFGIPPFLLTTFHYRKNNTRLISRVTVKSNGWRLIGIKGEMVFVRPG